VPKEKSVSEPRLFGMESGHRTSHLTQLTIRTDHVGELCTTFGDAVVVSVLVLAAGNVNRKIAPWGLPCEAER
jgi:hypothetical protein